MKLLAHVGGLLEKECYVIENIDETAIAQKPKLRPYIDEMEKNVAEVLHLEKNQVNQQQRPKGSDLPEPEQGISAQAICALSSIYESSVAVGGTPGGCAGCGGCR